MIVFSPKDKKPKFVVTAFTDIDCGYCRKMHAEMQQYNDLGIEFRYAAFPRSGLQTPSYFKAVAVWCAKDRNKAMTFAKGGAKLDQLQSLEQVANSYYQAINNSKRSGRYRNTVSIYGKWSDYPRLCPC